MLPPVASRSSVFCDTALAARIERAEARLIAKAADAARGRSAAAFTRPSAEGVAQLAGAATAPAHRRRGVHTALLAARLADAATAGCLVKEQ
jgi:GNAT superfamily N-acetyltransferase